MNFTSSQTASRRAKHPVSPAAIALSRCTDKVDAFLGNVQFGLRKGGAEHIVHTVRELLDQNPDFVATSTDCGNAFNSIDRLAITPILKCEDFNSLWSYWQLAYGSPTLLRVFHNNRSTDLLSSRGTRQGDPTASALFCLGLQPVLLETSKLHPTVHILAYMDDIYVVGRPADVEAALRTLYNLLGKIGLNVRRDKCHVYGTSAANVATALNITHTPDSLKVLSACISRDPAQASAALVKKLEAYQSIFATLHESQIPKEYQWQILSACGPCRWNYWARTHIPDQVANQHVAFDDMIRTSFCHIAEISTTLTNDQKGHLHLPQRMGGMGLTSYQLIGPIAYQSSASTDPNAPDQRTLTDDFNEQYVEQLPDTIQRHLSITKRAGATAWLRPLTFCSRPQAFALALQHRIRHHGTITLRTRCNACETELDPTQRTAATLALRKEEVKGTTET
jgi:hypothetical protein